MARRLDIAVGILVCAALDRNDVRKVGSVYYDDDGLVVHLQSADPSLNDVAIVVATKATPRVGDDFDDYVGDLEDWADNLLDEHLGIDDDESNQDDHPKEPKDGDEAQDEG